MAGQVKFSGSLHGLRISGDYTKKLEAALEALVREAAREFIRAIIVDVAVWSGFAKGSIKFARGPGGDLAAYLRVAVPIVPSPEYQATGRPKWYYPPSGGKIRKIPENAGRFASYSFPNAQHRYRFRFRDDVVHFVINDFFSSVSRTSPWHSLKAGREAFKLRIRQGISKLPKVKDFIVKGKVNFLEGARYGSG